jgi:hypothetical protein
VNVNLEVEEYNARVHLQKERMMMFREPPRMSKRSYSPALNLSRELRWVNHKKPGSLLSGEDVVREIIEQVLALVDRLNKGKVPSHDYD